MKTLKNMTSDTVVMIDILGQKDNGLYEYSLDPIYPHNPNKFYGCVVESEYMVDNAKVVIYDQETTLPKPNEQDLLLVDKNTYYLLNQTRNDLCYPEYPIIDAKTNQFLGYGQLVSNPGVF